MPERVGVRPPRATKTGSRGVAWRAVQSCRSSVVVSSHSGHPRHLSTLPCSRTRRGFQIEVRDPQGSRFLHAGPAVVQEQQHGAVAQGQRSAARGRQCLEQCLHLIAVQVARLGGRAVLDRDRLHAQRFGQRGVLAAGPVPEEAARFGQPLAARGDAAAAHGLDISQKIQPAPRGQIRAT